MQVTPDDFSSGAFAYAADLLCTDVDCVRNGDLMAVCDAVCSMECKGSYGTAFFDHLAADGAGLTGGQVTVVTVGQIYANFLSSLHLELLHGLLCLGNIDLIVLHIFSLLHLAPVTDRGFFLGLCSERLFGGFSAARIALPKLSEI